ncbi:AI-2E family transporter [soil metagenome]
MGPQRNLGRPGAPFSERNPFLVGFYAGLGLITAIALAMVIGSIQGVIVQIVVAFFIAAGLDPAVRAIERRRVRRSLAVTVVVTAVIVVVVLFFVAIVPVITDQVTKISANVPDWLADLQRQRWIQDLDDRYQLVEKVQDFASDGDVVANVFGGVLGIGLAVLGFLLNFFVITVMTLYFLAGLEGIKHSLVLLAPASRRDRVMKLSNRVIESIGGYVSGAFLVALCAGSSSMIFLFSVGLGEYAVALSFVVMLLDVIPMIGATIGAVVVTAIGLATDIRIGIACAIFYLIYQQVENYLIYPRIMSKSVDVPGSVTVIAALIGASLIGVVGALIAVPTAAAVLMLLKEILIRRQDDR